MLKSNKALYLLAAIVSVFLLWLWYFLGFNHVDAPLDLVLSILWWVLVLGACMAITRIEKKRRERLRTCYVCERFIYNSEAGTLAAPSVEGMADGLRDVIKQLEYGFEIKDRPSDVRYSCVVRSHVFDLKQEEDPQSGRSEDLKWSGEVAIPEQPDRDPIPFSGKAELQAVLERLMPTAA